MKLLTRMAMVLSLFVMVHNANAASNQVLVDQIGDSSNFNITQTGAGNSVGDSVNHATFTGNSNLVTIDQIGNMNTAAITVTGSDNAITASFTGNSNDYMLNCNFCNSTTITDTVVGNSNIINRTFDTTGGTSTTNINSDNNTVTVNNDSSSITGSNSSVDISGGNGNTVQVRQSGTASTLGHDVQLTIVGATNTVNIDQGGAIDSRVNATITGSGNTMSINSNYSK